MLTIGSSDKEKILIVDDNAQILRLMRRRLEPYFDEIFTTEDPNEATRILEANRITHLLCDFELGVVADTGGLTGAVFVQLWRREFPEILRAVIFTGADVGGIEKPAEVDRVISKTAGVEAVIDALLGEKR